MLLLAAEPKHRTRSHDLALGGTTAISAGMVNVAGVMAFFAFSSNVTGHVAIFTEELSKGHWHQVSVVVAWLLAFLIGAALANTLVQGMGQRLPIWGRCLAPVLQIVVLVVVGYYCQFYYAETLRETEYLVAALLLAMGLQNGTVATVSGGVVKTTHLTGLFTDLGIELAMALRGEHRHDAGLRFKLALHTTILSGYLFGGIVGGLIYMRYRYVALFLAAAVLMSVLVHDLVLLWRARRTVSQPVRQRGGESCAPSHAE